MSLQALGNLLGTILILSGITIVLWQPEAADLGALFSSKLGTVLIGLALIIVGMLTISLPRQPTLNISVDALEHRARTGTPHQADTTAIGEEELATWKAIWSDPIYIGALLADGVSEEAIKEVSEHYLANPGGDFVVSPGAMFVADPGIFAKMDSMSPEELGELGFYDERPPHGPAVVDMNLPVEKSTLRGNAVEGSEAVDHKPRSCSCRWVWTFAGNPHPENNNAWRQTTSGEGNGEWFSHGPVHGMYDSWSNNCRGGDGSNTEKTGWMKISSKVVCDPKGCCSPKGNALALSDYRAKVGANSASGFCFFANSFGSAVGANAVQLYVDGTQVLSGSGAVMASSGANAIGSIGVEIGAGGAITPNGTQLSGSGRTDMTASKTRSGDKVADVLNKFGSQTVAKPAMVSELQSGAKTLANVHRKASATGEQITSVAGMGQVGVETECGAGSFWAYRVINTRGPVGRAGKAAFVARFRLIRDQFLA